MQGAGSGSCPGTWPAERGAGGAKGNTSNAMSGEHIRPEPQSSGELLKLILKHVRNFNEICVCVSLRL